MLLIGLLAVGIGWIVSSLHVYLRDTAQVLAVVLTFWFWFTPIFITESMIPPRWRFVLRANPLAYLVRAYRDRLLSSRAPSLREMAIVGAYALAAFVAGGFSSVTSSVASPMCCEAGRRNASAGRIERGAGEAASRAGV